MSQIQSVDNNVRNSVNRKHVTRKLRNHKRAFLGIRPRKLGRPTIADPGNRNSSVVPQPTFSLADFAERTQIQGVKDWYYAHSKTSACAYFTIVLLFSTMTVLHVWHLVDQYFYFYEAESTSIEYDSENYYGRYPEYVQVCMEQFIDPRRVAHYMIQTLVQHPAVSNTTMDEFVNTIFPNTGRELIDKHLNGTELKNIANVLDVSGATVLLSNGSGYLNSSLQVVHLIGYYAKTFQHLHLDKINRLFSFLPEQPHNVISAISALHRDNLKVGGFDTSNVTVGQLNEIAVSLSFEKAFRIHWYCVRGEDLSAITIERSKQKQSRRNQTDANCKLKLPDAYNDRMVSVDFQGGLCYIIKVNDSREGNSFSEAIQIVLEPRHHLNLTNKEQSNVENDLHRQFQENQPVQVRLSSPVGIHTVDYAVVEMGTKSSVTYDVQISDRRNLLIGDKCVETWETYMHLLGTNIPYNPTTCRFSPKYWKSANRTTTTKCDCMKDIASYMVNEPWASMVTCDEVWDLRRGLCNNNRCSSLAEEQKCMLLNVGEVGYVNFTYVLLQSFPKSDHNCSYTYPKCLEPYMRSLVAPDLEMRLHSRKGILQEGCLPLCFETKFTAISTTIVDTFTQNTEFIQTNVDALRAVQRELSPYTSSNLILKYYDIFGVGMRSESSPSDELTLLQTKFLLEPSKDGLSDLFDKVHSNPKLHLTVAIRPRERFNTVITSYFANSIDEAASEIGGAISLYLGASLFSMVHLFLLLLNGLYTCCSKGFKRLSRLARSSKLNKIEVAKNQAHAVNG